MYIAFEGVEPKTTNEIFEKFILMVGNKKQIDVLNLLSPMPSYTWWEQIYNHLSTNKKYLSELSIKRANYNLQNTVIKSQCILGQASMVSNVIENWPEHPLLENLHVQDILEQIKNIPCPDIVVYVYDSTDGLNVIDGISKKKRNETFMHFFDNRVKYGFDKLKVYFIEKSLPDSEKIIVDLFQYLSDAIEQNTKINEL